MKEVKEVKEVVTFDSEQLFNELALFAGENNSEIAGEGMEQLPLNETIVIIDGKPSAPKTTKAKAGKLAKAYYLLPVTALFNKQKYSLFMGSNIKSMGKFAIGDGFNIERTSNDKYIANLVKIS